VATASRGPHRPIRLGGVDELKAVIVDFIAGAV
jgi:hypothetical protein